MKKNKKILIVILGSLFFILMIGTLFASNSSLFKGAFSFKKIRLTVKPLVPAKNFPLLADNSCFKKSFKMGFILAVRNQNEATPQRIAMLNRIKTTFASSFHIATNNLATMDTIDSVAIVQVDDSMFNAADEFEAGALNTQKVVQAFYRSHDDLYDFLTIFNTSEPIGGLSQRHITVKQNIRGISNPVAGVDNSIYDRTNEYGSSGKLLGYNDMRNIDGYIPVEDLVQSGLLHETGHQWCCYVGSNFDGNAGQLKILHDGIHYYTGLQCPYEEGCPMESAHWVVNADGITYSRYYSPDDRAPKYEPFTLYFMGLLPGNKYSERIPLFNAGVIGVNFNPDHATLFDSISVNDIIDFADPISCAAH